MARRSLLVDNQLDQRRQSVARATVADVYGAALPVTTGAQLSHGRTNARRDNAPKQIAIDVRGENARRVSTTRRTGATHGTHVLCNGVVEDIQSTCS